MTCASNVNVFVTPPLQDPHHGCDTGGDRPCDSQSSVTGLRDSALLPPPVAVAQAALGPGTARSSRLADHRQRGATRQAPAPVLNAHGTEVRQRVPDPTGQSHRGGAERGLHQAGARQAGDRLCRETGLRLLQVHRQRAQPRVWPLHGLVEGAPQSGAVHRAHVFQREHEH